jgi:hypothetical protein
MNAPSDTTLYIAFSISGTNTFITASRVLSAKEFPGLPLAARISAESSALTATLGMSPVRSRRPGFDPSKEIKLQWSRLNTKAGKPLRSPPLILNRFNQLRDLGWVVDSTAFVAKHWKKETALK